MAEDDMNFEALAKKARYFKQDEKEVAEGILYACTGKNTVWEIRMR